VSTLDILNGLGAMLASASVATFRSNGTAYLASETAVTFKDLPATPDRVVCLSPFGASMDQPVITYGQQRIQLMFRGTVDPTDVDTLADAAFAALHGATNLTFGAVHVVQILRENTIPLGMDSQSNRWLRSDNYVLDVDLPTSTYRPS
jgi:hypothetical protein